MSLYKPASKISRGRDGPLFGPSPSELDLYNSHVEELLVECSSQGQTNSQALLAELLDLSPVLNEAASAIVDDSFTRCFKSNTPEPWNWNLYLFPLWCMGLVVRYLILFPLRLLLLISGWVVFLALFIPVHVVLKPYDKLRRTLERLLVEFMCSIFVASWTGVVKYHGPRPSQRPNQVFVANHTSMIDFIVLEQMTGFAVIMQKHPGWVGLLQTTILESVGCIWFNRTESKDRAMVAEKIKKHVQDPDANPLLIFPEGTCVNNEYTVMFKKGAFELGCTVCPVAIKYNKIFVDAFWNSRKQSFSNHLLRLMTSWAVVCDVWFLEPQNIRPGETPIEFAERVRDMIAKRAGIKKVPWDGYLKYYRPSPKLTEKKQAKYAETIIRRLEDRSAHAPPAVWPTGGGEEQDDGMPSPSGSTVRVGKPPPPVPSAGVSRFAMEEADVGKIKDHKAGGAGALKEKEQLANVAEGPQGDMNSHNTNNGGQDKSLT